MSRTSGALWSPGPPVSFVLGTRSTHQAETKEDDVSQEDGREQRASRVTRDLYTWLLRETKGRRVVSFLGELRLTEAWSTISIGSPGVTALAASRRTRALWPVVWWKLVADPPARYWV